MELYVSNIPLLIYEGTLGELETYNYFKLPHGGLIYKYLTSFVTIAHLHFWTVVMVGHTACYFRHLLVHAFYRFKHFFKKKKKKKKKKPIGLVQKKKIIIKNNKRTKVIFHMLKI